MSQPDWLQSIMDGDAPEAVEIPQDLGEVTRLATALVEAQDEVKAAEAELKQRKERLKNIQERALPDVLVTLGLTELTLQSGRKIKLKNFVSCSIPADQRDEAMNWLRENEEDEIIKNVVSITFAKGQDELAQEFSDYARRWNHIGEVELEQKPTIHPQTLIKFAKTQMEAGVTLPDELFSIHTGTKAEIK